MRLIFFNECRKAVRIRMDSGTEIQIAPLQTITTESQTNHPQIAVRPIAESYFHKGAYTFMLEVQYFFTGLAEQETIRITRGKTRVDTNLYFDRLYLIPETAACTVQSYQVLGEYSIKKTFRKNQRTHFWLIEPIRDLPGLVILWLIAGIALAFYWGWNFSLLYFPIGYAILLAINWVTGKISNRILKSIFKTSTEAETFYSYLDSGKIAQYYADPNRSPFMGEIEIN